MKFIHLSDLHIGKKVYEHSMLDDQNEIFKEILTLIKNENPDAVIIAGDVYDRSLPPSEAVSFFDDFIYKLSLEKFDTFIISGNHDSAERLSFGYRILSANGIHIAPAYNGTVMPFTIKDEYGEANIYMLPFIKPFHVRQSFPEKADEIESYTDALRVAVENMNIDTAKRNIIVSHQFVTGAQTGGSEISVGGSDNVECSVYEPFDYAALGHIHNSQIISGNKHIRYCGTPLKYSFSETKTKTVTVVEMREKGNIDIREIPLHPIRDMRTIEGSYEDVYNAALNDAKKDDYICISLLDRTEIRNALANLRKIYPNILSFGYKNKMFRNNSAATENVETKEPIDLFEEYFFKQTEKHLTDEERTYMQKLIEEIKEDDNAAD